MNDNDWSKLETNPMAETDRMEELQSYEEVSRQPAAIVSEDTGQLNCNAFNVDELFDWEEEETTPVAEPEGTEDLQSYKEFSGQSAAIASEDTEQFNCNAFNVDELFDWEKEEETTPMTKPERTEELQSYKEVSRQHAAIASEDTEQLNCNAFNVDELFWGEEETSAMAEPDMIEVFQSYKEVPIQPAAVASEGISFPATEQLNNDPFDMHDFYDWTAEENMRRTEERTAEPYRLEKSPLGIGGLGNLTGLSNMGLGSGDFMEMQEGLDKPETFCNMMDSPLFASNPAMQKVTNFFSLGPFPPSLDPAASTTPTSLDTTPKTTPPSTTTRPGHDDFMDMMESMLTSGAVQGGIGGGFNSNFPSLVVLQPAAIASEGEHVDKSFQHISSTHTSAVEQLMFGTTGLLERNYVDEAIRNSDLRQTAIELNERLINLCLALRDKLLKLLRINAEKQSVLIGSIAYLKFYGARVKKRSPLTVNKRTVAEKQLPVETPIEPLTETVDVKTKPRKPLGRPARGKTDLDATLTKLLAPLKPLHKGRRQITSYPGDVRRNGVIAAAVMKLLPNSDVKLTEDMSGLPLKDRETASLAVNLAMQPPSAPPDPPFYFPPNLALLAGLRGLLLKEEEEKDLVKVEIDPEIPQAEVEEICQIGDPDEDQKLLQTMMCLFGGWAKPFIQ